MKKSIQIIVVSLIPSICQFAVAFSQNITSGAAFSVFLCNNFSAKVCGRNEYGEFGNGTTSPFTSYFSSPIDISTIAGITNISAGYFHNLFLKNNGTVWACGRNNCGQLGDGTTIQKLTPTQVNTLSNIVAVSGGGYSSLFLKNDGTVWACGLNTKGQLGDGTTIGRSTPVQVISLSGINSISMGATHSLFLKNDGTVWACGNNFGGGGLAFDSIPTQINSLNGIVAISAGKYYSLFLKNDGSVWACGDNTGGKVGVGTGTYVFPPAQISSLSNIIAISADRVLNGNGNMNGHSLFLKNDGTVWACGDNYYGQFSNGTSMNGSYSVTQSTSLSDIIAISAGLAHSIFVKNDGTVWASGRNLEGQLGDATLINKSTAVQIQISCSLVGIKETENHINFKIYPNPSNGQFILDLCNEKLKDSYVEISNLFGETIYSEKITSSKTIIDLPNKARGIYFFKFRINNQNISATKIIFE